MQVWECESCGFQETVIEQNGQCTICRKQFDKIVSSVAHGLVCESCLECTRCNCRYGDHRHGKIMSYADTKVDLSTTSMDDIIAEIIRRHDRVVLITDTKMSQLENKSHRRWKIRFKGDGFSLMGLCEAAKKKIFDGILAGTHDEKENE